MKWKIGDIHPMFGKVAAAGIREGEAYRMFVDEGSVSLIPLELLSVVLEEKMKFEEQFPELQWKWEFIDGQEKKISAVRTNDIRKHCLSKQRVKEVIGPVVFVRGITPECNIINAANREKQRILEELGLDK